MSAAMGALGAFGQGLARGLDSRRAKDERKALDAKLDGLLARSEGAIGALGPTPLGVQGGGGGGVGSPGGTPDANIPWLRYATDGATRNLPISARMIGAMGFLPEIGVEMEVFSGGQPAIGTSDRRVGSTRHDGGEAADVFFVKDGRRLDWANPNDLPIFQDIVRRAKAAGLTGFGAGPGYMQPGSMHIGYGAPAVWGAGGKGANAPQWLREAYEAQVAAAQPAPTVQSITNRWPRPLGVGPT